MELNEQPSPVEGAATPATAPDSRVDIAANFHARLQMPMFIETDVDAWFYQLNFFFRASGIGQDAKKFDTVCSQLPASRISELRPIIDAAPPRDKYEYIQTQLINYFAESQPRRIRRIIHDMPLGDMRPSQLYFDMVRAAKGSLNEQVLLDLWASRLPPYAQAIVITAKGSALEKTRIADMVTENADLRQLNAVNRPNAAAGESDAQGQGSLTEAPTPSEAAQLISAVSRLLEQRNPNRSSRARGHTSQNSSRVTPSSQRRRESSIEQFNDCWFHRTFGNRAVNCRPPCKFHQHSLVSPPINRQ